jgi:predicted cobalt transporter CbtA
MTLRLLARRLAGLAPRIGPVRPDPAHTAYPRSMLGKLIVLVIVVAVVFWLLTKFRDSGRGGR